MDQEPRLVSVNTHLSLASLGIEIDIRLRQLEGRWIAVSDFGGEPEVGIGETARAALAASLTTLGTRVAASVMADPQLFGLSLEVRRPA